MALMQRLEMRQGQSLVMTPQLQQAIKLLQMSNLEVQAFVEAELERNPLLDKDESSDGPISAPDSAKPEEFDRREAADVLSENVTAAEKLASLDTDLDNVYANEARADVENRQAAQAAGSPDSGWSSVNGSRNNGIGGSEEFDSAANVTREITLADHLIEQLQLQISDPIERLIGHHLIGMLNERGYLTGSLETIAERLGAPHEQVERVLGVVQNLDPVGVGARDLKECLALQLKDRNRYDPAMAALIDNLELLARRNFDELKQVCGVDMEDILEMVSEIRQLNPKPGNAFGSFHAQTLVPDVFVRLAPDGTWLVELNSETLPRVLVDNQYYATVSRGAVREDEKLYLSECMSNATWLVKSLDQRARTILAVSREIVRQQDAFLVHGVSGLKPLNLKTVAEAIGMHESTVSRVTSNKYMATPRGTLELKYFFTTAISSAEGGDAHSSETVRHLIKQMIDGENAKKVLSDDMIVNGLRKEGIDIARRTVAKYREAMGISSSVQRRREKRAYG